LSRTNPPRHIIFDNILLLDLVDFCAYKKKILKKEYGERKTKERDEKTYKSSGKGKREKKTDAKGNRRIPKDG